MKKVLFVDCCLRGEQSRTKIIADAFLSVLTDNSEARVECVILDELPLTALGKREYERREALVAAGKTDDPMFDAAKQFAKADMVVVAAPFWDMGIPAKLKIYFENVSVSGITFKCNETGSLGLCNAERMVYITTRGMDIPDGSVMEQASPYLSALCKFFGINGFDMLSAYALDVNTDQVDSIVAQAVDRAKSFAKTVV